MYKDEKIISNISYCSLDFRTIYPELLDTAKKLSNKWDPTLSNESDPGNILIKEAAIVADKNNYHVDKNVLECFPLSATQQASARQLYDLAGYKMHWYRSAVASVSFTLLKNLESIVEKELPDSNDKLAEVIIPAGTALVDSSGEYVYTTLTQSSPLTKAGQIATVNAIQGNIVEYEINGTYTITINNLDENLRLYFPQNIIAENGIFVFNEGSDPSSQGYSNSTSDNFNLDIKISDLQDNIGWVLVDNISEYPAGSKVFSFGLDLDSDSCYIQFPEDIISSNLIGSGLNIYYTTTDGINGSIKTGILNKFSGDCVQYTYTNGTQSNSLVINDYLVIGNDASTQGKNPESLTEAYRNYKKTIGTYKTLVSRRDYDNAIYNVNNDLDTGSLISNGFVTDRTSDPNFSQDVIVNNLNKDYTESYIYKKDLESWKEESSFTSVDMYIGYYVINNNAFVKVTDDNKDSLNITPGTTIAYVKDSSDIINSYDILLYLLKSSDSMNYVSDYDKTFEPDISDETLYSIKKDIDYYKSVQHNFSYASNKEESTYHHINNVCILNGVLNTYYKITSTEAKSIQDKVIKTLLVKYNSREIDFGNELDYSELLETIKEADSRIKSVSLNIPTYEPILNCVESNEIVNKSLYSNDNINENNKTVAKMVLSGKVQLFKFKDDFQIDFGQSQASSTDTLSNIKTYNSIDIECVTNKDGTLNTILNQNDIIQIIYPSLITTDTYNPTVKYMSNFSCDGGLHVLSGDEKLRFIYNNNGVSTLSKIYIAGDIIRINGFNLIDTGSSETDFNNVNSSTAKIIRTNQSVEILDISNITIPVGVKYYIITENLTSDGDYELQLSANTPYILKENEYFIYTDNVGSGLVILASGTTLVCENKVTLSCKNISLDDILKSDDNTIQNAWNVLYKDIKAQENTIINLGKSDKIGFLSQQSISPLPVESTKDIISIESLSQDIIGIVYKLSEESDQINSSVLKIGKQDFDSNIRIRSNMLLNTNNITPQVLTGNQKICVDLLKPNVYWASSGWSILSNYALTMVGGNNVDVRVLNEVSGKYEAKVKFYKFESNGHAVTDLPTIERENGLLTFKRSDPSIGDNNSIELNYTFTTPANDDSYDYYLIPITATLNKYVKLEITCNNSDWVLCDDLTNDSSIPTYENNTDQTVLLSKILVLIGPRNDPNISTTTISFEYEALPGASSSSSDTVTSLSFLYMKQLNGINSDEIDCSDVVNNTSFTYTADAADILDEIKKLPGCEYFDWTYIVPDTTKVVKPLLANSYFNVNHIYNQLVLPRIDFENTIIKVNSSSIL